MRKLFVTNYSLALAGLLLCCGVIILVWPILFPAYLFLIIAVSVVMIIEYKLLAAIRLTASTNGPETIELQRHGKLNVAVVFEQLPPYRAITVFTPFTERLTFSCPYQSLTPDPVKPQEFTADLEYTALRLGVDKIKALDIEITSRLGIWQLRTNIPISHNFRVFPSARKPPEVENQRMIKQQLLLVQGNTMRVKNRSTGQLHNIREYRYPDPFKHIDQAKSAKFQRLMSREYEALNNSHLIVALDLGRALYGYQQESLKQEYYFAAVIRIIERAFSNGDTVSFLGFSQQIQCLIKNSHSPRDFNFLHTGADFLQAQPIDSNFTMLPAFLPQISGSRALLLILTDFSLPYVRTALSEVIPVLSRRYLTLTLGLVDSRFDLHENIRNCDQQKLTPTELSRLSYLYWIDQELRSFQGRVNRMNAAAVQIPDTYWLNTAVRMYDLLRRSLYS